MSPITFNFVLLAKALPIVLLLAGSALSTPTKTPYDGSHNIDLTETVRVVARSLPNLDTTHPRIYRRSGPHRLYARAELSEQQLRNMLHQKGYNALAKYIEDLKKKKEKPKNANRMAEYALRIQKAEKVLAEAHSAPYGTNLGRR